MTIVGNVSRKIDQRLSISWAQFQLVPFDLANHLPRAAVVAGFVDGALLCDRVAA